VAWRRPQVCVSAVAVADGHLLLVQRAPGESHAGTWAVPGGRVEPGEHVRDAVVRELREETGLRARCGEFVGWVERLDADAHYVILDFRVELVDPPDVAVAGDDAAAVSWVPLAEVAGHGLVAGLADFLVEHEIIPPRTG
jgi:8-oxo-dGTP diphosphatase